MQPQGIADALAQLPPPSPNAERFKTVLRRGKPDRVPLVELMIADEVLTEINGSPLATPPSDRDPHQRHVWAADRVRLWHRLGYDYYRVRAEIPFVANWKPATDTAHSITGTRGWADEAGGMITDTASFETYRWPTSADIDFAPSEAAITVLPDGMGAIGFSGGVLEWASTIMGLEPFMLALIEQPDLVRAVVDRVGQIILSAFEVFCQMEPVFAIWLGDDLGFKTSTLISPRHLRQFILPWHKRYADLAHDHGRFFILHSCGNIEPIVSDLIESVGIDAKHSFEDVIIPVEQFQQKWGDRLAVLGGVDVDLLSRGTPDQVFARTTTILNACATNGGYASGSGNSIANYIPTVNYLAMLTAVRQFNQ